MTKTTAVYATENPEKTYTAGRILPEFFFIDLAQFQIPQISESKLTLAENALAKAKRVWDIRRGTVLADDTGFFVRALNNEPGVSPLRWTTARFPRSSSQVRIMLHQAEQALLKRLDDALPEGQNRTEHRSAYFETVVAIMTPDGQSKTFAERLYGHVVKTPQGSHAITGNPFDRVFMPDREGKVLSEMQRTRREEISQRTAALQRVSKYIQTIPDLVHP